jgi:hypothetical protein
MTMYNWDNVFLQFTNKQFIWAEEIKKQRKEKGLKVHLANQDPPKRKPPPRRKRAKERGM